MARKRRPGIRAEVADGVARVFVPIDAIIDTDANAMTFDAVAQYLHRVDEIGPDVDLPAPKRAVSLVFDQFAFDLHIDDVGYATDVHPGDDFVVAAANGVAVFVVRGVDPRRQASELADAAAAGNTVAALVDAFEVDQLSL